MTKGLDIRTKATVEDGIVFDRHGHEGSVIEYQPGNGTKYVLVITRLTPCSAEALDRLGSGNDTDTYLVAKVNGGYGAAMLIGGVDHFLHPSSLVEKFGCSMSDAVVLAEFLGEKLGFEHMTCEEFEAADEA